MSDPTPIVMFGAAGRMGQMILQLALADPVRYCLAGAVERADHPRIGQPLSQWIPGAPDDLLLTAEPPARVPEATVAIHFSLPEPTMAHLPWSREHRVRTLVGTTGFAPDQIEALRAASAEAALMLTPNTSRGVNVLFWLAGQAARLLGPEYDIEIVEMHHHHKKDAPSGTARRLAEVVAATRGLEYDRDVRHGREGNVGARPAGEIGMHALRGGDVVGEHTVILAGPNERIELTHRAQSRELLADGALTAARWLSRQAPGYYTMQDMLGL